MDTQLEAKYTALQRRLRQLGRAGRGLFRRGGLHLSPQGGPRPAGRSGGRRDRRHRRSAPARAGNRRRLLPEGGHRSAALHRRPCSIPRRFRPTPRTDAITAKRRSSPAWPPWRRQRASPPWQRAPMRMTPGTTARAWPPSRELGAVSPLLEARLTKADIRTLSRRAGPVHLEPAQRRLPGLPHLLRGTYHAGKTVSGGAGRGLSDRSGTGTAPGAAPRRPGPD